MPRWIGWRVAAGLVRCWLGVGWMDGIIFGGLCLLVEGVDKILSARVCAAVFDVQYYVFVDIYLIC